EKMPLSGVLRAGIVVLVFLACCERLQADVDIDSVVTTLQNNFAKIVSEELGGSRLTAEYAKAQYTYDTLNFTSLVGSIDQGGLDVINHLFANLTAANSTFNQSNCCNDSIPLANCTGCKPFLNYVNSLFTTVLGSHGVEFSLGLDDGTLISPSTNLTGWAQDARLQPWFVNITAPRPREVVIVSTLPSLKTDQDSIKAAIQSVLTSLNPQDKVAVAFSTSGSSLVQSSSLQGLTDACDLNKATISSWISGLNSSAIITDFPSAVTKALAFFTSNSATDKFLLLFTDTAYPNLVLSLISVPVPTSIYALYPVLPASANLNVSLGILGAKSPADYYSALIKPAPSGSTTVVFVRETNSFGVDSLGVSQRVSLAGLSGVFHAAIPLTRILGAIPGALLTRPSSTFFVVDTQTRSLLYHPLLPRSSRGISLETVETGLSPVLNLSITGAQSVTRTFLLPLNSTDRGFVTQTALSTANCWTSLLLGRTLAVCVVVAASDATLSTLDPSSVSFSDAYSIASRLPVNSKIAQSTPKANQCNYLCTLSTKTNTSIQLSSDQQAKLSTLDSFNSFLKGGVAPMLPLAAEIAISTSASYGWIGRSTSVRSHLATPTGVYLTYPALQLVDSFQPSYTLWYTAAVTHPGRIALVPATFNDLSGAVYSVSSAVMATTPSTGQIRAVLASDRSLGSLRGMISAASNGACEGSNSFCFIIDDSGRMVYSPDLLTYLSSSSSGPFFMLNYGTPNMQFQEILTALISMPGFPIKQGCMDYLNPSVKFRVFYSFPLYNNSTLVGGSGGCQFKLKMIPGTNAFFGVATTTCTPRELCFCPATCINCASIQATACECPCSCSKDCSSTQVMMGCPSGVSGSASYMAESNTGASGLTSCPTSTCSAITDLSTCAGTVGCQWCYGQHKCLLSTDCCDIQDKSTCCQGQTSCVCNSAPVTTTAPSQSNDNTAIIAGVVGGVVGAAILAILVVFFVWYQCIRKPEADDNVRDNVFDFSKRTDARNPVNMEVVTSPNADFKEDQLAEKSNAKDSPPAEKTKETYTLPVKAESTI
ncbi:hypothetical protein EMCRGX_G019772, partial [Ephydatia muelleri]